MSDVKSFVIMEGDDDFVDIRLVAQYVEDVLKTRDRAQIGEETLRVVRELLDEGLIIVGTLDERDGVVRAWGGSIDESIERLRGELADVYRVHGLYELACVSDTPKGREAARRLRDRHGIGT